MKSGVSEGGVMDEDFCREQAQRIGALAERADPFTKRRLLALVGRYDPKVSAPSRSSKSALWPLPVGTRTTALVESGEAQAKVSHRDPREAP